MGQIITTVAGYQTGIPIKLVAYSTNNIRSMYNAVRSSNVVEFECEICYIPGELSKLTQQNTGDRVMRIPRRLFIFVGPILISLFIVSTSCWQLFCI